MRDKLRFFLAFLRHPMQVSSVIPTSQVSVREILKKIDGSQRRVLVEYGPGTGVVSKALLKPGKLTNDSLVILIEKTKELADALREELKHDPRVRVVNDSAENVRAILQAQGETSADYILCSIPLSIMPESVRDRILSETRALLKPDGQFVVFLMRLKIREFLRAHFPHVTMKIIPWNFPPLYLYVATKNS